MAESRCAPRVRVYVPCSMTRRKRREEGIVAQVAAAHKVVLCACRKRLCGVHGNIGHLLNSVRSPFVVGANQASSCLVWIPTMPRACLRRPPVQDQGVRE